MRARLKLWPSKEVSLCGSITVMSYRRYGSYRYYKGMPGKRKNDAKPNQCYPVKEHFRSEFRFLVKKQSGITKSSVSRVTM